MSLVERGGRARSFVIRKLTREALHQVVTENVAADATIMSDDFSAYHGISDRFARHGIIQHSKGVYALGDVSTNTVKGHFSLLKRGIIGTFHQVRSHHLHRYCSEFDFRYCLRKLEDGERTDIAIKGAEGKRMMYREH